MINKPLVIGIAGGTNSGKTTLVKRIADEYGNRIALLSHDFYYKAQDDKSFEDRCLTNYDHPDAFETDLLVEHIIQLKEGKSVIHPVYDFASHNRSKEVKELQPSNLIIVEGILIFADERVRDLCDIKIFIDAPADIRVLRRIKRDIVKRGRTPESVMNQYLATVRPMHEMYVEPSKQYADLIIPNGGKNPVALDFLKLKINSLLDK